MNDAWINALIGGTMIGLASGGLMLSVGRIAGISSVLGGLIKPAHADWQWRLAFLAGMIAAGAVAAIAGGWFPLTPLASTRPLPLLIAAGLLVGAGTSMANGCTSGHGVCGLALFSTRSLVAVATFLGTGFIVTYVMRHLLGST